MTAADELVAALGLIGAVPIDREEYDRLPEHQRAVANTDANGRGYAHLRLPDPPPVAALREIARLIRGHEGDPPVADMHATFADVDRVVSAALAEFDRTKS